MINSMSNVPRNLKFHEQSIKHFVQNSSFLNTTSAVNQPQSFYTPQPLSHTHQPHQNLAHSHKPKGYDFYNRSYLLLKSCNVEDIQHINRNPVLYEEDIVILPERTPLTTQNIRKVGEQKEKEKVRSCRDLGVGQREGDEVGRSREAEVNQFLFNYRKNQEEKRNKKLKFLAEVEARITNIEKQATNLEQQKQQQYKQITGILKIHSQAAEYAKKSEMVGKLNLALHEIDTQNKRIPSPKKITDDMELLEINAAVEEHRQYNDALLDEIERVSRSKSKEKCKNVEKLKIGQKKKQSGEHTDRKKAGKFDQTQSSLSRTLVRSNMPPRPNSSSKKLTSTMKSKP